jgi:uncharacterized damage-inducible protein DinB
MASNLDSALRQELIAGLKGVNAHARFEDVVADFPAQLRGRKLRSKKGGEKAALPYSAWQLLEHICLAQDDILRFCNNHDGSYREATFPDDYWPKAAAPPSDQAWQESVAAVLSDRDAMIQLIADPEHDLAAAFPWGSGQNLLREAVLVIDHTSYHVGELLALRRLLGVWPQ